MTTKKGRQSEATIECGPAANNPGYAYAIPYTKHFKGPAPTV